MIICASSVVYMVIFVRYPNANMLPEGCLFSIFVCSLVGSKDLLCSSMFSVKVYGVLLLPVGIKYFVLGEVA